MRGHEKRKYIRASVRQQDWFKRRTIDEALITAVVAGDADAMQVLFERHNVRIFQFVTRQISDAS
jgi:hypothetical protein